MKKIVKCCFCDWETNMWRTTKKGKVRGPDMAFERLKSHVWMKHPDEMEAVTKFCETPTILDEDGSE